MIAVTDASFEVDVRRATLPVLLNLWAPWCPPCESLTTELRALAPQMEDKLLIAMANVAECGSLPARLGVILLPTLILFVSGKEVTRVLGVPTKPALGDLIAHAGLSLPTSGHSQQRNAQLAK